MEYITRFIVFGTMALLQMFPELTREANRLPP